MSKIFLALTAAALVVIAGGTAISVTGTCPMSFFHDSSAPSCCSQPQESSCCPATPCCTESTPCCDEGTTPAAGEAACPSGEDCCSKKKVKVVETTPVK